MDEFHSSETSEKATRIFYFAYCMRTILERMNNS
jgi:hypothetical protein